MNEVTKEEKSLSENTNFEISLERLFSRLADLVDFSGALNGTSQKSFSDLKNDWVQVISKGHLSKDKLIDVRSDFVFNSNGEESETRKLNFNFSLIYAIAAQRAYNRKEVEASWSLLVEASSRLGSLSELNENYLKQKMKVQKSDKASKNASVPGERLRYQIIGLLTREYSRPGWESIDLALDCVKEDLINYLNNNKFKFEYDEIFDKVEKWLDEYPAFRAEFKDFFVEGVIRD